ncbi:tRNA glutamyl-Q(34) synthetase GluQRS [Paenibacillus sp. 1P07SE]|uniref:tRNA glutamyl-Q(34) synthetase GluQRS n=1 Tax=Paenibacillus sp. 1P07SE TaxID=3132209 RepID=UPI0039A6E906
MLERSHQIQAVQTAGQPAPDQPASSDRARRGRFAPTPSGQLHLGNAFAALAAWLQIRQAGGTFVLRVEDIDKPRSKAAYREQQLDDLRWLGIDWDEGPDIGGPHAPYLQSLRDERYEEALARLEAADLLYPCYCSRAELASIASAPHGLSSEGPAYPGLCRHLTATERAVRAETKIPALRFRMPETPTSFIDAIAGRQDYTGETLGDFVVKRADGMYSYQLAVTVDDAAMGITDVVRGADLLDSTPRQLALYAALGLQPPRYAHVPLLGDGEGERFSKRDKSLTLQALRQRGVPAERLIGLLAFLAGWQDRPEPATAAALIGQQELGRLPQGIIPVADELLVWLNG